MKTTTDTIHALAKTLGIKNPKAAGRTREVIIAEIVAIKGWGEYDEATLDFLLNGGEIQKLKPEPNAKPDLGNQASAGKSKRRGGNPTEKAKKEYVLSVQAAVQKLSDEDHTAIFDFMNEQGVDPYDKNVQVWGDGGLCDVVTRWGLKVVKGAVPTQEAKSPKTKKANREPRAAVSKEGLVSLAYLCEELGVDGKVARRKLRAHMEKPEAGWHFTPAQVKDVQLIITK